MKILEKNSYYFFEILEKFGDISRIMKFRRVFEDLFRIIRLLRNDKIFEKYQGNME
jgi:hypothetical protein